MYVPSNRTIYENDTFSVPPSSPDYSVQIDVRSHGYPASATAVDLLIGCRSKGDGAYVAAYDGTTGSTATIAVYPTAPLREDWDFGRGRVQLSASKFLLRVRFVGHPVDVTAVLKGYYALE